MIILASKQERELLTRLRAIGDGAESVTSLSAEVLKLKQQISDLQIQKSKLTEDHAREDRELRHMIGLEKKRQAVEIEQATREAKLAVREENLLHERKEFERQLAFNTERFQSMEKYLKEMFSDVLKRLPNVNVKMKGSTNGSMD